jgi:hypothetical protein
VQHTSAAADRPTPDVQLHDSLASPGLSAGRSSLRGPRYSTFTSLINPGHATTRLVGLPSRALASPSTMYRCPVFGSGKRPREWGSIFSRTWRRPRSRAGTGVGPRQHWQH